MKYTVKTIHAGDYGPVTEAVMFDGGIPEKMYTLPSLIFALTDENGEGQAPAAASTEEPTDDEGDGDTDEEPAEAEAEAESESETTESDNPETE